jgi:environmental stress-induced protein Ves
VEILHLQSLTAKNWSGGTTTELFIYPEETNFQKGNYQLRVSLATVEKEATIFTPLPDTLRTLLVLEGSQLLQHQGKHTADLRPMEQDTFSGDWTTECVGTSVNFNVKTRGDKRAQVKVENLHAGTSFTFKLKGDLQAIYLTKGQISIDGKMVSTREIIISEHSINVEVVENVQLVHVSYPLNAKK